MSQVKMAPVSVLALSGRAVLVPDFIGPVVKGGGSMSYVCSSCDTILLESVGYKQVQNVVVKCGNCGTHGEIPRAHHAH